MAAKRKHHAAAFKVRLAPAVLKGDRTVNESAEHYGVHSTLIHSGRKLLLQGAASLFGRSAKAASADAEARQTELFEQFGRPERERERLKKSRHYSLGQLRSWIDEDHSRLSVRRPCELPGLNRPSLCCEPVGQTPEGSILMRTIDRRQYAACPPPGGRPMTVWLPGASGGGEPEASPASDADNGPGGDPSEAEFQSGGAWAQGLPVPACRRAWRSSGRIGSGAPTSPMCLWGGGLCIRRRRSTGTVGTWSPGGCRTHSTAGSGWRCLKGR